MGFTCSVNIHPLIIATPNFSKRLSMLDEQENFTDTTLTKYIPGVSSDLNFFLRDKNSADLLLEVVSIYHDKLTDNCG